MAGKSLFPQGKGFNDSRLSQPEEPAAEDAEVDEAADALKQLQALGSTFGFELDAAPEGTKGALISALDPSKPLVALATLASGDIITHVDDEPVETAEAFYEKVKGRLAGEVLKIMCVRAFDNRADIVSLELEGPNTDAKVVRELREKAGLPVNDAPLYSKDEAEEALKMQPGRVGFRIADKPLGVEITAVHHNTTAEKSSAKVGDIIIKVNGKDVKDTASFMVGIEGMKPGDTLDFVALRNNAEGVKEEVTFTSELGVQGQNRIEAIWALRVIAGLKRWQAAPAVTVETGAAEEVAPAEKVEEEAPAEKVEEEAPAEKVEEAPAEKVEEEAPATS